MTSSETALRPAVTPPDPGIGSLSIKLRGKPNDTEIAIVMAVLTELAARAAPAAPARSTATDPWGSPALVLQRRVTAAAALPHASFR